MHSDAFKEGLLAYRQGFHIAFCPYAHGTPEAVEWEAGFITGEETPCD